MVFYATKQQHKVMDSLEIDYIVSTVTKLLLQRHYHSGAIMLVLVSLLPLINELKLKMDGYHLYKLSGRSRNCFNILYVTPLIRIHPLFSPDGAKPCVLMGILQNAQHKVKRQWNSSPSRLSCMFWTQIFNNNSKLFC